MANDFRAANNSRRATSRAPVRRRRRRRRAIRAARRRRGLCALSRARVVFGRARRGRDEGGFAAQPDIAAVAALARILFARGETVAAIAAAPVYARDKVALETAERLALTAA